MNRFSSRFSIRRILAYAVIAALVVATTAGILTLSTTTSVQVFAQSSVRPPADAVTPATPQPGALPQNVDPATFPSADLWRSVRRGISGRVSIPDQKAAVLVQSEGENFRAIRNGPLSVAGFALLLFMIAVIAIFFVLRGNIKIEAGPSGKTVERFNVLERFTHWLTAVSFLILALTGLNMLYGRYVLRPIIGPAIFSEITQWGKYFHNYVAFAFMLGLVLMFVLWVRYNFPTWTDVKWLARGGGLFTRHSHPAAAKFNAGQKFIFWAVVIGGGSLSISGIALLFPFEVHVFAPTFKAINAVFSTNLPTVLTSLQETQLSLLWHGAVALILVAIIIAHIYIGSALGMEGAFSAMGSGQVDVNWAREHHSLWLEKLEAESEKPPTAPPAAPAAVPAE